MKAASNRKSVGVVRGKEIVASLVRNVYGNRKSKATQARPKFQSSFECFQWIPTIMYWERNCTSTT